MEKHRSIARNKSLLLRKNDKSIMGIVRMAVASNLS
jgi:hypothetical protein